MSAFLISFLLVLTTALPAVCDDQAKAKAALDKATAMASDPVGKRAVSLAVSEMLSVQRSEVVRWRKELNLNYGEMCIAHHLMRAGTKIDDIASQMKNGQTIWRIADQKQINWKEIASEAKKMNSKVDANLLKHFSNHQGEVQRDQAEGYDPAFDTVKADGDVSQKEVEGAQQRYLFLRDHARSISDAKLDTSTEGSARMVRTDPIRTGGPSPGANSSPTPPR